MLNEILDDIENPVAPADAALNKIAALASLQLFYQKQIAYEEEELKKLTAKLREVSEQFLPDAMAEAGVTAFALEDGSKIVVKPFYGASITAENQAACHDWLENHGHGALIKKEVTAMPPRDDMQAYVDLRIFLDKAGLGYKVKEGVHQASLNAFVKEQMEAGQDIPKEMFKVYTGRKAKITEVK